MPNTLHTPHQTNQNSTSFAPRILAWFWEHGRHDLPWQQHKKDTADVYAVWLSEVMLQQTQVATVISYYERFILKFPTVQSLANAKWEDVAQLWAGLGYYARARNLHTGAKQVADFILEHGDYPQTVEQWQAIKGVGRSTAGAIVAMGVGERGVICDGNVKRVLTRWAGIDGDITKSCTDKQLWQLAETLTPNQHSGHFAQAMMDMGATICTRTRPKCTACPIQQDCHAYLSGDPTAYPIKSKKSEKPHRHSIVLALFDGENYLWQMRSYPNKNGIWNGLWCLPLLHVDHGDWTDFTKNPDAVSLLELIKQNNSTTNPLPTLPSEHLIHDFLRQNLARPNHKIHVNDTCHAIKHTLTHFYWHLSLATIKIDKTTSQKLVELLKHEQSQFCWSDGKNLAIPKAMDKLL